MANDLDQERTELVTDEEAQKLILALAESRTRAGRTFTDADVDRLEQWAKETLTNYHLLQMILAGHALIDFDAQGQAIFQARNPGKKAKKAAKAKAGDGRQEEGT